MMEMLRMNKVYLTQICKKAQKLNKYHLTRDMLKQIKVLEPSKITEPLFRFNSVIDKWMITKNTAKNALDWSCLTYDEFMIMVDPLTWTAYVEFHAWGGMASYNFQDFFNPDEIEFQIDLEIQEQFIETINDLLDCKIIKIKNG